MLPARAPPGSSAPSGPVALTLTPPSPVVVTGAGVVVSVGLGTAPQQVLQRRDSVGQHRWVPSPLHGKAQRPIQSRELVRTQPLGLAFPQPDPGDPLSVLDLIIERNGVASYVQTPRQRLQPLARTRIHQLRRLEHDAGPEELIPAADPLELASDQGPQSVRRQLFQGAARPAPELIQLCQDPA